MKINSYGQVQISEIEAFDILYTGQFTDIKELYLDNIQCIEQFNQAKELNADGFHKFSVLEESNKSIELFDAENQSNWFIPDEYRTMDISSWLYNQCQTDDQRNRVSDELELFVKNSMYEVLQYLKYLVDTMRQNNVVWGVGRGSSVSSYVLFLLGVHKIDSLRYQLDISEFFK